MEFDKTKVSITFERSEINPDEVYDYLKTSYWAKTRTLEEVKTTLETAALVIGLKYEEKLIGFARLVSDCVNFGYLCDVFIKDPYKGMGLGKFIVTEVMKHPICKKLKRISLNTKDAHKLYEKYGFLYDDKKSYPGGISSYSMTYGRVDDNYFIKYFTKDDMDDAVELVKDYWNPDLVRLIHPMFYRDFYKTCFSARTFDGRLIGFVLGFVSQDNEGEGYIHAAFVHPDFRRKSVAKNLYSKIYWAFLNRGVKKARLITTVENTFSQSFHQSLGFDYASECDKEINGIPVASNYYGAGKDRAVMEKDI